MSASRIVLFFISLCFAINLVHTTEFVPCFIWSNKRTNKHIPALNKISQDTFKDIIQLNLKEDSLLVIFAEQTLSPEDFVQHDQSDVTFSNLAKLSKSTKVSYLPNVQNPFKVLKHLDVTITETPVDKFEKSFEIPETDILIINLNDAKDSENRLDMLKRHDNVINKIFQDLTHTNENVWAIYTAYHTSWVASEELVNSRQTRSLLQTSDAETPPKGEKVGAVDTDSVKPRVTAETLEPIPSFDNTHFYNTSKVFLYVSNSSYNYEGTHNIAFTYFLDTAQPDEYVFQAVGTNTDAAQNITLTIKFSNSTNTGYWVQESPISVEIMNSTSTQEFNVTSTANIYAPSGFSFHCGDQIFYNTDLSITLKDFQIELFFDTESTTGKFNDAYDCVGFTTVPIWSGLFITTILLIIMSIGITMMMDIKTMDRFDDAKGKTITINAE